MLKDVQQDRIITRYWWAWLISIIGISCIIRFYFLPWDLPPILDGIDDLAYSLEIRNSGHLPERWPMANNGWPSMLGSIFSIIPSERFFDFVNYYRISNLITSVITIIPINPMITANHLKVPTFSLKKNTDINVVNIGAAKAMLVTVAKGNERRAIKIAIKAIRPAKHLWKCKFTLEVL